MPASLSTHVLDLTRGKPAAGMLVELHRLSPGPSALVTRLRTNADGRSDGAIVSGVAASGVYELRFHVADYFKSAQATAFLDIVPIRFGLDGDGGHHHVPLLVSPFGYSTYRGS